MTRRVLAWLTVLVLGVLFFALDAPVAAAASPPAPGAVADAVRERIQNEGWGRVLVQLRTPAARGHVPEGALSSQAAVAIQRGDILTAQSNVLKKLGATRHRILHRYASVPYLALEVGPDALRELQAAGLDVARVVDDQILFPMLPESVPLIQGDQAWARGYDGTGTVIAMIDTGIELSHQFVHGKVVDEACFSSGPYPLCPRGGAQETGPGSGIMCVLINACEHGTMTSGIAAGNGAAAGVSFSGVAKGARLASYQVFSGFDCGQEVPCLGAFTSDIMAALERVLSLRATHNFAAVNMSLGGGQFFANCDDSPLKPVIDNLRSFGIATVVAAGNNAWRNALSHPACISSAISVGSTSKNGVIDSFFTNAAPFMTFFAPGNSILTSWLDQMFTELFPLFGLGSGTSLAAPHVAGAWAILKQAMPGASVDDLVAALQATGTPVTDTRPGGTVTKPLVRVEAALDRLLGPSGPLITKLTPDNAVAGAGDFTLAVDGANFAVGSIVLVNGVQRPTTVVSDSRVSAAVPASDIAASGSASVSVRNPDGRASNAMALPIAAGPCLVGEYFAEYFSNNTLSGPATRTACERPATEWEPFIRASWGMAAPEGVPVDNFSVRWTGRFPFGESTDYLFRTRIAEVANEIRVYVDGVLIADDVRARSGFQTVTRSMTAGLHEVRIEYLERGGGAGVLVEWFHLTAAQPAVTNLVPAIATAGDASFTLTAEGTGFQPGATLYWNGSARPTTVTSATQLSASISAVDIARAGTAWITIRNADGQRTFGQVFRIADPAATAPTLSALTPDTAMEDGPDFTMVVTGTDFVPGVTVVWGNAPIPTTFESATRLTARVSGATELHNTIGEVWVTVRNPDGQTSNVIKFVVVGKPRPTPTLTALTPSTAAAGGPAFTLTLDGTGLDGVGVYWNGVFRPTRAVSSTRVTADIPASDIAVAGTFPVDVRPISGVDSNRLNFTVTGGPQTVTISALTPSTVVEGGPAFTLTIDGGNFVSGAVVLWNGAPRPTTFISANRLTADLSAADVAAAGSFVVTVRNPDLRVSNAVPLTVTAAPTLLVSFTSPDEGATVSGSVLVRVEETGAVYTPIAFTVTLDGNFMAGVSGSATSLGVFWDTWKYPNGAHTLAVTVRDNAGRTATATRHVTVAGSTAPIATALTPASAPAGGPAFTLTVDGTGFVSGGVVTWNGSVRTTTFVSATRVTASITAADIAAPGSASVMVWNPDFGRSRPLTFTIGSAAPAPTLSSLTPGDATAGGPAFALDVDGRNFVSGATVLWNGAARPTTFVSATRVTASIAAADIAAPGSAQVSVRNPDLQTSNTQSFSIAAPELQALFTSPAQGASVSGTVSVGMSATGTSGTPISFTLTVDGGQVFTTSGTATTASLDWNTAGYAAGAHTLGLTVRDGAGRTATATRNVTVTGGTLRVAITQPGADGATVSGTTWFVLWVEGAAAGTKTYTLSVGGVNVATTNDASSGPISMGWDTRQVVDGTTTVIATARDAAGNTGSAPRIVTVSNGPQPLVASFTSPGEGAAVSGAVSVAMSESGGTGTITWTLRLDGGATPIFTTSGAATTASFSWDTSAVAPGAHRLDLTVQDGGGRTASATRNVTVASPAPLTASFTSPAEGATVSGPVTVGMSESGGTGTITWTVRLDGGATPIFTTSGSASTASFTWDSSTVAPGAHRLDLTVQDGAGRTATATRAVTAQAAGSIRVFITQPAEGATIDAATTATVWFTIWIENAAAGSKTYTLSIDGAVVGTSSTTSTGPVSMPWTVGGTSNGPHAATISVRDAAGNSGSANRALTVTNASGPAPLVASFMSPAEGANVNGVVTIGMSETGADGTPITFTLTVDGAQVFTTSGTAATASFGWNADSVAAAQHTLGLTVRDGAGRTATATRHVTVTDVPPPPLTASFTSPAEGAAVSGAVAVGLSETGGTGTLTWTVRLDGSPTPIFTTSGTATTAGFTWDTGPVPAGTHRLDLTVQDGGGRTATATRNVTVQPVPTPTIRVFITQPGSDGQTVGGTVWFTIWIENAAAGSKTCTLSIGGAVVASTTTTSNGPVSMPWTSNGTPNGAQTATVSVRDSAGATGSADRRLSVQN